MQREVSCAYPEGFDTGMFGAVSQGEAKAVEFFNLWVDTVKKTVPKDQLLIHEAKDGWEPLCKFLEVEVPANPYPRVNDTAEKEWQLRFFFWVVHFTMLGIPGIIIGFTMAYFYMQ